MSAVDLGEHIRQFRLGIGLSVRTLATQTGLSPSLISQVEHGHVTPSIGSLERIAMVLGVSLGQLFAEPEPSPIGLVRATARPQLSSTWSPVSIEALGSMDGAWRLEPVMLTLAPGGRSGQDPTVQSGEKFGSFSRGKSP